MNKNIMKKFIEEYYELDKTLFSSTEVLKRLFTLFEDEELASCIIGINSLSVKRCIVNYIAKNKNINSKDLLNIIKRLENAKSELDLRLSFVLMNCDEGTKTIPPKIKRSLEELDEETFFKRYENYIFILKEHNQNKEKALRHFKYLKSPKCYISETQNNAKELLNFLKCAKYLSFKSHPSLIRKLCYSSKLDDEEIFEAIIKIPEKILCEVPEDIANHSKQDILLYLEIFVSLTPEFDFYNEIIYKISFFDTRMNNIIMELLKNDIYYIEIEIEEVRGEFMNRAITTSKERHPILNYWNESIDEFKYNLLKLNINNLKFIEFFILYEKSKKHLFEKNKYGNFFWQLENSDLEILSKSEPEFFDIILEILLMLRKNKKLIGKKDINELLTIKDFDYLNHILEELKLGNNFDDILPESIIEQIAKSESLDSILSIFDEIDNKESIAADTLIRKREI